MSSNARIAPRACLLLAGLAMLAGCGKDPPPAAPADSPAGATTEAPEVVRGIAPQPSQAALPVANSESVHCNIETIAGESMEGSNPGIASGVAVEIAGWYAGAADGATLNLASENGAERWTIALPALAERPDVATALKDESKLKAGFVSSVDLSDLKPGSYSVYLSDATQSPASICGLGRGFTIR